MMAENSTASSRGRAWFREILERATELIVKEDPRLAGIAFSIVQADSENGVILKVIGATPTHRFLPEAPVVFKKFIREAAHELEDPNVKDVLRSDPEWPLLAYAGHFDTMDDPEGAEVFELPSSAPPKVETRVDTSRRVEDGPERIEHPAHYNTGSIEVWDATDEWGLGKGFNRGSAIKYIARAGEKPGSDELEDLKKAAAFLQHEIERMTRERAPRTS